MTKIENISNEDLADFLKWYANHFKRHNTPASVLTTCMAGYFHISSKEASALIERCKGEGLLKKQRGKGVQSTTLIIMKW